MSSLVAFSIFYLTAGCVSASSVVSQTDPHHRPDLAGMAAGLASLGDVHRVGEEDSDADGLRHLEALQQEVLEERRSRPDSAVLLIDSEPSQEDCRDLLGCQLLRVAPVRLSDR